MTLLIISPDYASHLLPLATLGTAWRDAGERVVVATGPATASIVESFGFERVNLQLGRGSNPGVIRAEDQPKGEDDALRGFFDASRVGAVATLSFQATARLSDLMWDPVNTARAVQKVVDDLRPDHVIVDHLAFSARLALLAQGTAYADVVLGHPSALPLPAAGEVYGFPPEWPVGFSPEAGNVSAEELADLLELCNRVSESFTLEWNTALAQLNPDVAPSANAFAEHGDLLLLNYPEELHSAERTALLPPHEFLGSAVREEPADEQVIAWLESSDKPFVYVSFGSFLSVRGDVLARVLEALKGLDARVAIATGSADRDELGDLPGEWLVREFLPQVTLLQRAAAAVTHGGNNSVTESMNFGVPLLVLPFSTDQFAGAAAIERVGFGVVADPNAASVEELRAAIARIYPGADTVAEPAGAAASIAPAVDTPALTALSASLLATPGRDRAYRALHARTDTLAPTPAAAPGSSTDVANAIH